MKICLLYSKEDFPTHQRRGFLRGAFLERNLPFGQADILVIPERVSTTEFSSSICNEAKRTGSHGIFIDSEKVPQKELITALYKKGFEIFTPFSKTLCDGVIPVIETEISGGSLSEYLESAGVSFPRFAVSVRRSVYDIPLPADRNEPPELSQKALRTLISSFEPDIFFSPQLMCKYFLINRDRNSVQLILFDDAETVSGKLRLAKKHGASHAFLVYREIADIFDDIYF